MKFLTSLASFCVLALSLSACGSDEKTTIIHERPVVVQPGAVPSNIESGCAHGYDNRTRSCY